MQINNLQDLVVELVSNGVDCTYVEKFNSIFINDVESPNYTRSIYESKGKFLISVKIKGKPTKDHNPTEKAECYIIKDEITKNLNALEIYNFPVFKPAAEKPNTVANPTANENDPFSELNY